LKQNVNNNILYYYNNKNKPLKRGLFCFKIQLIPLLLISSFIFSQEKLIKTREVQFNEIEINSDGLDNLVIENSLDNQISITLLDEQPNTHTIFFDDETNGILKVDFKLNFDVYKEQVFRKYITKRLQRAKAIIKIPKNKNVTIYGKTIGINSNSYKGDLKIYIDRGNVRLNRVNGNTLVALFLGNVYGQLRKNSNINIKTNKGDISINKTKYKGHLYKIFTKNAVSNFKVRSINANVFLIRE
jgi:hypothetical protein